MSWQHFERLGADYASARPPYPAVVFEVLRSEGVIGAGLRVLEVGAGAGLATRDLVASGSEVVALEPGRDLASLLAEAVTGVEILTSRLEDADLPRAAFDSVVAATSLHWVDLAVALPRLHETLRPGRALAVFRTIFGDDGYRTEFRDRVQRIVSERETAEPETQREGRPTMDELSAGGYFRPVRSERWRWSVELTTEHVTRLFRTFSNWTEDEVRAVQAAAEACGGIVTEHYQSVLHVLRRR
ncbi:MAG TPA: methyltransferase domain-containing protein [Nocardioides sp.]|uniref:class I SAM-dependent methyltransferase n=1 Tax=Nocardioides sp. TaxID=35761 RepID=UPI002F420553